MDVLCGNEEKNHGLSGCRAGVLTTRPSGAVIINCWSRLRLLLGALLVTNVELRKNVTARLAFDAYFFDNFFKSKKYFGIPMKISPVFSYIRNLTRGIFSLIPTYRS